MRLNKMQKKFREAIFDPAALDENFRSIFKTGGIATENRMKVYRNNVMKTLTGAVTAVYPLIETLAGADFLKAAAAKYAAANPPEQGNLNFYGATFADFLAHYEPARDLPYLSDVARMEWAWELATLADDDAPLRIRTLQNIPEDKTPMLRLRLRASVQLVESRYPLDRIVDFCRAERPEGTLNIGMGGAKVMIFRPELQAQMRKVSDAEFIFLRALRDGNDLMRATEWAVEEDESFDLSPVLQRHLALGTFKDFEGRT